MTASFLIVEGFIWIQLIFLLTIIAFCFLKCLSRYMGSLLVNLIQSLKNLLRVVFITSISYYGKLAALYKLLFTIDE